jgi:hypothetical protein
MMMSNATKPKGDISSVFGHLGGKENTLDAKFLDLKKELAAKDPKAFTESYNRLLASFEKESKLIQEKGSDIIPQITLGDIIKADGKFPEHLLPEIRKRGCVVIRNVIDQEEAKGYKEKIQSYVKRNNDQITGFPAKDPQVYEVYWTESQIKARSHPNFDTATLALNSLWHATDDTVIDLSKNLAYCDRLRIRRGGDSSFALQEHIDSGSLERWLDPEYRKCYTDILNGNWEVTGNKALLFFVIINGIFFFLKKNRSMMPLMPHIVLKLLWIITTLLVDVQSSVISKDGLL